MLTALVALSLIARPETVTFETTGAPVTKVVERLAELTGRPLIADLNLAQDILIVSLRDAREEDALKWIADAIDAEWREDKGKQRLSRFPAKEIEQERNERSAGSQRMREMLDAVKVAEPIDKEAAERMVQLIRPMLGDPNTFAQLPYELGSRVPMQRLVTRIAKDLDYSKFADLPDDVRIYIPFDEQGMDSRLPRSLRKHLQDFKKEDALYSQAITQSGLDLSMHNGYVFMPGSWNDGPLTGAVSLTQSGGVFSTIVALRWGSGYARQEGMRWPESAWANKWKSIERPEWAAKWEVPALTRDFAALRAPAYSLMNAVPVTVPQNVVDYFTAAEDFDIFGLGTGRLLIDASKLSGMNLVACLPDSSAILIRAVARFPSPTVQQILDRVVPTVLAVPRVTDDLIMFKSARPHECRRDRMPRETIRKIVKDGLVGKSDLMVYARMAARCESGEWISDPRDSYAPVTRIDHLRSYDESSTRALRLYGSLTDAQRDAAARDVLFVPWMTLPREERTMWGYVLLSEGHVGFPGEWGVEDWPGSEEIVGRINAFRSAARSGREPDGISVKVTKATSLIGGSTLEDYTPIQLIEESGVSSLIAHKELGVAGWDAMNRFTFLPYKEIKVSIRIGGKDYMLAKYGESYMKEGQTLFGFDSIPKDFIESRRKEIDAMKKLLKDAGVIPPSRR